GHAPAEKRSTTREGRGTWYDTGLGACGWNNVNSDTVIALSPSVYSGGSHCGQTVTVTNVVTGAKATGTVADECPGCGPNDIDMTPGLFQQLGSLDEGVLTVSWTL
uniref:RlpA-like protein double-psi beta-barrel domain-containing protein n=1 Tax=Phanerochaete carnosa (strain HHB-10118-sp) TaxID=650164 RepID=UPI003467EDEA